jgi:hypothetical protein
MGTSQAAIRTRDRERRIARNQDRCNACEALGMRLKVSSGAVHGSATRSGTAGMIGS